MTGDVLFPRSPAPGTDDPAELRRLVDGLLGSAPEPPDAQPMALLAPHAGLAYSGAVAAAAFASLRGRRFAQVVLLGPSHHAAFRGAVVPEARTWRLPLGDVPLDPAIALPRDSRPFVPEHCLEIRSLPAALSLRALHRRADPWWGRLRSGGAGRRRGAVAPCCQTDALVVSSDFTTTAKPSASRRFKTTCRSASGPWTGARSPHRGRRRRCVRELRVPHRCHDLRPRRDRRLPAPPLRATLTGAADLGLRDVGRHDRQLLPLGLLRRGPCGGLSPRMAGSS